MTPYPDFKVRPFFDAEYLRNGYRYVGLPLTSTQVLVNTGSTLIQAANNEEGGGGSAYLGPQKVRALTKRDFLTLYFMRAVTLVLLCPS